MSTQTPIAIVGVSALFPGSTDSRGFWRDILAGKDLLGEVPPSHWLLEDYFDADDAADKTYARRGAFLDAIDFAPMDYGVPPNILAATDTGQLLAMIVAKQLLDDTFGAEVAEVDRSRIGVVLGVASTTELCLHMAGRLQQPVWEEGMRRSGLGQDEIKAISTKISEMYVPWEESTFPGLLGNVVSGRIANRFDLGGTNCVVDAACASSLAAMEMGINQLCLGQADMMITGGVDALNDILMYMCFSKTGALSKSGDCRPFSAGADGTMLAEGLGMFALKRLDDAEQNGDRIYAVIRGVGSSSDGRAKSIYAPRPEGQAKALRRAYAAAGYGPRTVELIEAHGTATPAGDAAETSGLKEVFGGAHSDKRWCALGSVKSQIGHAKAAAGAAGFFKAVMALNDRILPPTIKVDKPSPALKLEDSPFYINTEARPWIRGSDHPRRNAVSAFGFGGTNFHVTLEEYTGAGTHAPRKRGLDSELVLLSAAEPAELLKACQDLATDLDAPKLNDQQTLIYIAKSSQASFDSKLAARLAIVADDDEDLRAKLAQAVKTLEKTPKSDFSTPNGTHYTFGAEAGQVGFLFPGQGSQYVGMGAQWAMHFEAARGVWDLSADLEFCTETRLHEVAFPAPAFTDEERAAQHQRLTATQWAQPALGAASASILALVRAMGLQPACVGGHSFGEITALHSAGVFDEEAMLRISRKRGELMAASDTPGAMTAVSTDIDTLNAKLTEWGVDVVVANHNSPSQVVLSGATTAIEAAERHLEEAAIGFKRLPVSTAFHSSLVSASSVPFGEFLDGICFAAPKFPVFSNTLADTYPSDPAKMRRILAEQLANPVRFVEQVQAMYDMGVRTFVEVGPNATLTGLVGKCLGEQDHHRINFDRRGRSGTQSMWNALGYLATRGIELDFAPLWSDYDEVLDPRAAIKPGFTVPLSGTNFGKPYPADNPRPTPGPRLIREPVAPATPAPIERSVASNGQLQTSSTSEVSTIMTKKNPQPYSSSPSQATNGHAPVNGAASEPRHIARPNGISHTPAPAAPQSSWVEAFREQQRSTAEAHRTYQETTAEAHRAFLETMDTSFRALGHLASHEPMQARQSAAPRALAPTPEPVYASPQPQPQHQPVYESPRQEVRAAAPTAAPAPAFTPAPAPAASVAVATPAPQPVAKNPVAPSPAPQAQAPKVDVSQILLEVVSQKTGYPSEMLEMGMELEADLGVDSIKQVEIMAAMEERIPALPEIEPSEIASLATLQAIADYLQSFLGSEPGASNGAAAPSSASTAPAAPAAPAAAANLDINAILLAVVSEKTGYPGEMLDLGMELESDLGVDSIKQVEIMAAMEERIPSLPEIDSSVMAELRSLRQISEHIEGLVGGRAPRASSSKKAAVEANADDDPESDPASETASSNIGRFPVRPVETPAGGWAMPGLHGLKVLHLVSQSSEVGSELVALFETRGTKAVVVEQAPADAEAVILLDGLQSVSTLEEAISINRNALLTARDLVAGGQPPKLFVTVQNTGGAYRCADGSIEHAWLGGLGALAKTAAAEWPESSVKSIDLDASQLTASQQATAIIDELYTGGPELEVGLGADGRRVTPVAFYEPADTAAEPSKGLAPDSVIVVSGGARGVTATSVIELAGRLPLRFVLLGRTALVDEPTACHGIEGDAKIKAALLADAKTHGQKLSPRDLQASARRIESCREIRSTLQAIEAAGSQARYDAVNVRDASQVGELLDGVRAEWGPVSGVIHGAGVLADARIEDKTAEQFDFVFGTKIEGLDALLTATREDPLTLLCLFSSVAARSGNAGQSDYAMANEVLNKIAHAEAKRRGPGFCVKSLGWGPWDGGMVTPALKAHFEREGVVLLPTARGAQMLSEEILHAPVADVEVVLGGSVIAGGINGVPLARGVRAQLLVHASTHPYLDSHRLRGIPVVPAMLVLEWFVRFARACAPHLVVRNVRDLEVLHGIKLKDFDGAGDLFSFTARAAGEGPWPKLELELRGADDTLHYKAVVAMAPERDKPGADLAASFESDLPASPMAVSEVYQEGRLFHGPNFEVLTDLQGLGADGGVAALNGLKRMSWPAAPWQSDPAAMDGALQVSLLWGLDLLGKQTLPMRVANFTPFVGAPSDEPLICKVRRKKHNRRQIVADVLIATIGGVSLCELQGVEMFAVPENV